MITVKPLKRCGVLLLTTAVAMMFIMSACSRVAEGDRLIYVPPASAERNVLIEDFTGQRCVNCPAATKKIEELHSQYGDRIIPVAIHSGPFAHRSTMSSPLLSLGTATGDEFYRNRGVEAQPGVAVNRHGGIIYNTNLYATAVAECIAQETPLNITATCQYEESSRSLTVNISANAPEKVSGKLEVWLVEDNITDTQLMADGSANQQYVHNHVFRKTLTADIYGDPVTIDAGKTATAAYTTTVDDAWKSENLAVVVFVSNPAGIVQVIKTTL